MSGGGTGGGSTRSTILGVSGLYHDSAAALVRGSEILAAAQEERFTRARHDPRFPEHAVGYCIEQAGGAGEIDAVAFYEDPVLSLDRVLKATIDMAPASEAIWPGAAVSQLGRKINVVAELTRDLGPLAADHVFFVDHHMSHAASAFYPSPFAESAVVVVDGMGEWASTTIAQGQDTEITPLSQIHFPHSLGLLYAAFTYHCGLKVNSGEYKLMGLAPYGQPRHVHLIMDSLIDLRDDGSFRVNTDYFGFLTSSLATNEAFERLMRSPRRAPESRITPEYMDIAASAQAVIDEAMLRICRRALAQAGSRNLCLAGGVALNCVSTGRLLRALPGLEGIWVQPASGDAGGALGAALHVAHAHFHEPRHAGVGHADAQRGSLLGPAFSPADIEAALREAGLQWRHVPDAAAHAGEVARALADGLIVGRFEGRMEFGPRALGNRSVLADPRRADGQAHVNQRIKFRESWRPFAPMVLAEHAARYFDLGRESPYMLLVGHVREELRHPVDWAAFHADDADMLDMVRQSRSTLPAITHVDYSARLQTVGHDANPALHDLMTRFHAMTGCAVLVNTSFNQRGEPIVCTPRDAALCFINTGIDLLAIGPYIVRKADQTPEILSREGSVEFEHD